MCFTGIGLEDASPEEIEEVLMKKEWLQDVRSHVCSLFVIIQIHHDVTYLIYRQSTFLVPNSVGTNQEHSKQHPFVWYTEVEGQKLCLVALRAVLKDRGNILQQEFIVQCLCVRICLG